MKTVLVSLATAALVASVSIAADTSTPRKAPEFAFNVPGQGQKLLSELRGKVVALSFIWTTCPHCQAEAKMLEKLQQEYGPRGFQAIDVAVNDNADLKVENFSRDFQTNFPVGWASRNAVVSFMGWTSDYFVVPQMVLIDRKGYIHYQTPAREDETWDKLMKEDAIRQHIEELLSPGNAAARLHGASSRTTLASKR